MKNVTSEKYILCPANEISEYLGGNNFGDIAELLSQIDDTANLITWIYGKPNYDLDDMLRNFKILQPLKILKIYLKRPELLVDYLAMT
ncbi:hypothetical protein ICE98_03272 [Lactococcus lactis]|nr:hypothetical protein [Lactococcus lactis]